MDLVQKVQLIYLVEFDFHLAAFSHKKQWKKLLLTASVCTLPELFITLKNRTELEMFPFFIKIFLMVLGVRTLGKCKSNKTVPQPLISWYTHLNCLIFFGRCSTIKYHTSL